MNKRKIKRKHVTKWLNVALICMLTAALSGVGTTLCALADVQKHTDEEAYFKAELVWNNDYSGDSAPVYSTEHSIVPVQNRDVSVKARNDGDEDMFVRMYLTTKWVALEAVQTSTTDSTIKEYKKVKEISASDATTVSNGSKFKQSLISLTQSSESDSKWVYDDEDGCYYYDTGTQAIQPDEETGNLVTTVSIDKSVGSEYNDNTHHDESSELNKYVEYGAGDGGTDKVYYAGVEVYVTLQAVSIPIPHTVKFVTNNGQTVPDQTVKHNRFAKDPNDLYPELMSNPGKVFAGWYTKSNFATDSKFNLTNTQITSDVTLYAKWVDSAYDISLTFDANGGTYSGDNPQTRRVEINSNGAKFTDTNDTEAGDPTKEDYVFMGWYTSNGDTGDDPIGDGWGQRFNFNQSYYQDQKVYAKWAPVTEVVRVTYVTDTNGDGTLTPSTVRTEYVTVGELATKPDDPVMLGYNFKGWFTRNGADSGVWGTQFDFETTTIKRDITLYAQWEDTAVEHTVTFDTNNGAPLIASQSVKEYRFATQPADPFIAGKKFAGWYTDEGTWKNNWNFNISRVTEDVTLHARWVDLNDSTTVDHKVYFNSKGGSPTPATQTVKAGQWATEPTGADVPTKEGFIFGGWWQDENNAFSWGPISNDSLTYAKWIEIVDPGNPPTTIQVTYDSNGGSNVGTQTIAKGATPPQPTNPIRVGYNFVGWFKDNGQQYNFDEGLEESTNLTAKWEEVSDDPAITAYHNVTFDSKDGTAVPAQSVKDGWCAVEPNPVPMKVGYVFVGWYYDENCTNEYCFSTPVVTDVLLYAKWKTAKEAAKTTHKVWFDGNEGTPDVQKLDVKNGEFVDITKVQTPTREGYTFTGWWSNDHDAFSWESPIDQETYAKAHWKKNDAEHPDGYTTYEVTFHSNGGSKVGKQTVAEGDKAVEPTTPLREGYTFEGWYSDPELTQDWDFDNPITENVDLYANWTENENRQELTVTFNSQGGSEVAPQTVLKGDLAKRPADPTKDNKTTFAGWYTDSSCTVPFDFSTQIVESITLYAKWESSTLPDSKKTDLTVTFLGEGGTFEDGNHVKVVTVKRGATVDSFDEPTKDGYTFAGWWINDNNAFDFSITITNNLTVWAHWEKNDPDPVETHLVEFIENGGTTVGDQTIADGKLAKRPDDPTRDEYTFVNWYADEGCTEEFDFDIPITMDTKVYAKWKANIEYTVSFETNYGVPLIADQKVGKDEFAKEPVNPIRAGKQFVGWYSDNNTFRNKWNFNSNKVTEDITLYAKWVDLDKTDTVTHKVSFDSRGGSVTPATQTVKDGEFATEPTGSEIPTKEGYVFRGWWKDTNNAFVWGPIHNDETAYAKWIKVNNPDNPPTTIVVTYDSNGGSEVGAQTIEKGTTPPKPDNPVRIGYAFKGWFMEDGTEYDFHTVLTESITLTAQWEELSDDPAVTSYYNVTFNSMGGTEVDTQSIKEGQCAIEPTPTPTKENYVFVGWYYDESCTQEVCFTTPITHDITLYACWKSQKDAAATTHKVWFVGNGGTPELQKLEVKNEGYVDISQITTPTREGYTFLGWWIIDKNAFSLEQQITQETLVVAHWAKNDDSHPSGYDTYEVIFHSNGGSEVGIQTVIAGETATKPSNPIRLGYTFVGWFTNEEMTQQYNFDSAVNSNIDLYAKWDELEDRETLTLTFNTNGGTEIEPQKVLKGDVATRPNDPTKGEKDVFAGWFANSACTIPFDFATPLTQSLTIYAKWQTTDTSDKDKVTFNVTFKTDGGVFADGNHVRVETVKNGETVSAFDNPTKEGWTFTGWWIDSNNAFDFSMPISNDITVTAHWTKNDPDPVTTYVVEFVENGGSAVGDQTVAAGKTAVRPNDPARKGYTFVNWYKDEGLTQEFDFATPINRNTSVYAKWKADVEFTVSFNTNYGVPQIADQQVGKDDYAKEPVNPVRAGKSFAGWYTDNNTFQNKWNFNVNTVTEDITLHARWIDADKGDTVEHKVSFDAKGGSPTPATQTVKDGEFATEPTGADIPTREGYVFRGWWKDANNAFVWGPIHNDETAYAKWIRVIDPDNPPTTITVTYDSDGGSEVGAQVIEAGTTPPRPDDPVKLGYTFLGWFNGNQEYDFETPLNDNTTLTAHWEKLSDDPTKTNYYKVTFDSKGGSAVPEQSVKEADCAVEPYPAPTKEGYVFTGWYYDEAYTEEACFSTPITADLTLYASWKTKKEADETIHKVWFMGNGGQPDVQRQDVANGGYIDFSQIQTPTREGYTFTGWWYDENNALALEKAITQETVLTAHWKKNDSSHPDGYETYVVTYHSNGGSPVGPQSVAAGDKAPKPTDPIRIGYTFGGWYTDKDLSQTYNFDSAVNANIDLYAKWTEVDGREKFTVKFDTQGGTEIESQSVALGDLAVRPGDPVRGENEIFAGWFNDKACTVPFDFATPITQSMTIYAKWENKTTPDKDKTAFTVTFKTDGGAFADGNQVRVETVKNGECVEQFDPPTKEGWTFVGWWLDDNNAYDFTMPITNNLTVTAHWSKNDPDPLTTYVVEFVENGGSPVGDQTVVAGETAVRPNDPTRIDYTFVNWYSDEGLTEEFNFSAPITKNVKAYAKWKADVEYTVTFETNYGVKKIEPQKVGKGEFAKEPVAPVRAGKQFVGWYTDNNTFLNKWNFGSNPVTQDITLYAKWVDLDQTDSVTHKVSFDSRGGSVTPATQTVKDGEFATEPTGDEIPTRDGYVFRGWWKDASNAFVWGPIHNDETAYAKWIRITDPDNVPTTITVTYDSNGGSEVGAQVIESGTTPPRPDDPQRIGYEFTGWFKADGNQYDFYTDLTENTTLTAHWQKLSDDPTVTSYYNFTFDSRGGTPVATQSVKEGDCAIEPEPVPTMQGSVFVGWFYETTYENEVCFSTPVTNDVTVYAKWKSAQDAASTTHKVWFDANGGTPEVQKQEVANGAYIDASKVQTPTREGYTFLGWWYNEGNALAWEKAITQETYVQAHWEKNDASHPDGYDTYTVVFHANGGTNVGPQTVVAGKTATKPTDPIREGYDFKGWFTDEGLTRAYNFSTAVNDNLDLYAKWEVNGDSDQLTVRFDSRGGSSVPTQTVIKNNCAKRPTDPTKDGQVFAGWYLDKNCIIAFDFATPVLKPLVLYAKWEKENTPDKDKTQFTVTFKGEGGQFADGNYVKTFNVKNGSTVAEFDNPTREGYTFCGWWLDDNNGYDFSVPITNDTTIYAHWSKDDPDPATTYLVEFIETGGSAVGDQVIVSGQTAKRPNDPTKKGYNFLDWYTDEQCTQAYDFTTPVTANMKLYAGWEEKVEYTVSFDTNFGSPQIADQIVEKNHLATEPIEPSREGRNFAGWYLDEENWSEMWDFNTSTVTDNITLHARWVDLDDDSVSFTVKFDSAQGSPTPSDQTVKIGEYAKEPTGSEVPTRSGYTFGGWWENDETAFAWGPIHSDKTATAHWITGENKETVKITFNYNGGGKNRVATIAKGGYLAKPSVDPSIAGYNFLGWFKDDGQEFTFDNAVNEDITLTAKFEEISDKDANYYNVIFDSQGGSDVESQKVKEGQCAVEPMPAPTKENSVFAGWFYDENFTEEVVFSNVVTQDLTLYASWKTKEESDNTTHKVWFLGNGGTPEIQRLDVKNEGYVDLSQVQTPTREGYTFTGWWYSDKDAFAPEKQITQETCVRAHWEKNDADHPDGWNTYIVTYHPNGGSAVGPQCIKEGGLAPEPTSPVRAGYKFAGWFSDEGLTQKYNFSTPVTDNIDLYAKWTENSGRNKVTVKFETSGGTTIASQTVLYGEKIKRPGDPTRGEDEVFAGWYTDSACTIPFDFGKAVTSSMTLYAKWENADSPDADKTKLQVTFKTDGGYFADGNQVRVEEVVNGSTVTSFDNPTKDGYTFTGWWIDSNNAYDFSMPITNNLTVTAHWTKNNPDPFTTYVVEFVENGGSPVGDQTVIAGGKAVRPDDPTREDYKFVGWYSDEGLTEEFNFATPITRNTTVYAKWKALVEYTVSFELNYGAPQIASQTVGKNEYAIQPADPIRAGKTFVGWYTDNDTFENVWNFNVNKVTKDTVLYARWVDMNDSDNINHTVSFDAKGGSPTPASQTVKDGDYATEPSGNEVPTRDGYVFRGWWQDASNGFVWGPIHSDKQAYAKWIRVLDPDNPPTTIVVSYDSNGGSPVGDQTIEKGTTPPRPTDPTKVGYKFLGWYKADGSEYAFNEDLTENTTLTAKWQEYSDTDPSTQFFTVKFDSKGGSAVDSQKVKDGQCAVEPNPVPFKQGMVFTGWYYDEQYTEEACFSTPVTKDITLYAQWKTQEEAASTTHKVWFDGDDGEPELQWQDVVNEGYVDTTQIKLPEKEGYTFNGWWYNDHDAFAAEKAITQETYVKAHWVKNDDEHPDGYDKFVVTYHSNGGSSVGQQSVIAGQPTPKPTDPVYVGHTFKGWFTDEALTQEYDFSSPVTENIDLYAKWTENANRSKYTVTFNSNGGTAVPAQTVLSGDKVTVPMEPQKDGQVFSGWFTDEGCTIPFDFGTPITSSMILYAKWVAENASDDEKPSFDVTFKAEGGAFADGSQVRVESVKSGSMVNEFDPPTKEGWTFAGWWIDNNNAFDFSMTVTDDMTLFAHWAKNDPDPLTTYVVEFEENGGSQVGNQTIVAGQCAKRPTNPTYADHTFIDWYFDEGLTDKFDFATPITGDITLYAKWKSDVEYTVTFETNRGVPPIEPQIVGKNEYAKEPADPQLGGKKFAGWYTDDGAWTNNWVFNKNKVTEDVTLYARWVDLDDETVTHKVEFDARGGNPTPDTQYVIDGEYATEPTGDQVPTRTGYVFKGWWQDANNGFAWGPITNDEYPFAKWIRVTDPDNPPETVVVTYDSNGGSKVGAQVVEKGKTTPKPTDPVKVGYKFQGWFTDEGTEFDFHTVINESMTLTAHWKELEDGDADTNFYTVKFDSQGGSSVESQKIKEGQCAVEPAPVPTYQGMVFVGWFYDQGCTEEYVFSTPVTGDLTLYASWKTKDEAESTTHKVWFDGNGGTPSVQRQDVKNGDYVDASAVQTPTREGYTFSGWWHNDHDAFAWEKAITQETHVKAHWTKNGPYHPDGYTTYVVTYHSNGGTEVGPQTIVEGATAPKPTNPIKVGYTFVGWYTEDTLANAYNFNTPVNSNLDLYAKWVANSSRDQFTVRFDTRGGSSVESQQVYYGDTVKRPGDPTKEGKAFAGWFTDMDCTTGFDFSTPIVKPTTIYAKWDDEGSLDTEFTITFKAEGGTFDDGSYVKVVTVKNGETVPEFDSPTKDGCTFGGWWLNDNNAYDFSMPVNNDMTVKAHWIKGTNIKTYIVEFVENGGSPVGDQVVEKGKTAKRPDDPTQDGYNFKGWYADEDLTQTFNFSTPINADTKVYAKWEEKVMFKVTFETNYGAPQIPVQEVEQGKLIKEPTEPTRAGKKFAGWYTDNDVWKQAWNFSSSKVNGDVTLYARWIDLDDDSVAFKVSFDTQGGSPKPATQAVKAGEYAKEPTAPKRKGYTFSGWWKNDDTAFAWGPIHSDETAVAHWISGENKQTVKVSFDYNGGGKDRVAVIEKGTYVPQPSIEPAKAGYNFVGWFTDEGVEYTFDEVVNADLNLTAKFEEIADSVANFYTVTFNSNGGSEVDSQKVKEGKCAAEPVPVPTKDGLVFCGWYFDEALTEPYFFANPVTKDITLYACWKDQSDADSTYHKIYFDGNGGTPNLQTIQVQNGKVADVTSIQTPTREGYTFLGWWYDDNNAYDSSRTVYQPAHIKAHWIKGDHETATVTFHSNGGTTVGTQIIVKGQPAKEPTAPYLDGYKLNGWYTKNGQTASLTSEESQPSGVSSLFGIALAFADGDWGQRWNFANPVQDNLDLYAKWDLAEYTVSFDTDGGSKVPDQLVTRGSCATQPANPTKTGYTFGGWFADADRTVPFNFYEPITGKTTVYARWFEGENVKTYNVTFNTLGGTQISGQIVKEGECAIEPTKPTRAGYTFGGWTSEKDDYTPFSFDVPIYCDTIVYVRWYEGDVVLHTVTFDSRGGTPNYEQVVKDGDCVVKPAVNPTREGYTFGGWFRDVDGKIPYNFKDPITSDLIIYAYWYAGDYKTWNVTFESNGGSSVADQVVRDGYAPIKPDNPTKDGASFVGWYKDPECNEAFNWSTDVITRDTTLYAKWQSTEDTKEADATTNGGNATANGTYPGGSASASSGNISKTGDDLVFSPLTIALAVLCFISLFCCVIAFLVGRRRDRDDDDWEDYDDYNDYNHFDNDNDDEGGTYYGGVVFAQIIQLKALILKPLHVRGFYLTS